MRFDPIKRRFFLMGAGVALAAPFLPSLLPRGVRAQEGTGPIRYVQVFQPYGPATRHVYGSLTAAEQVQEYVGVRPLRDVGGDISAMIGSGFSGLKDKISLLHGLDVINENGNHNYCFPSCASGYAAGLDGDTYPPVSGQPSVDILMAESAAVYGPETPAARRALVINPVQTDDYSRTRSFSWQRASSGAIEMIRPTKTTIGLTDILATGFGNAMSEAANEQRILDAVYEDFRRTRDSSRLSMADRERMDAYMAILVDASGGAGACQMPMLDDEVDIEATVRNQFRLLAASMLCDLTRVASITLGMSEGYGVRHTDHHDHIAGDDSTGLYRDYVHMGEWVADLVQVFDSLPDGDGTLLDASMIYWGSQYGNARPGDSHRSVNMPVMVAGGARGRLQTGYYIDYRKDGAMGDQDGRGVPLNNLLVTFMNAMGMSSADYEEGGSAGYGSYRDEFFASALRPNTAFWSSTEGRRSPLPFFYLGEPRG